MPIRAPSLRPCGCIVPVGQSCPHQRVTDRERKARHDRHRPSARARGYNTQWDHARRDYLQAHPLCACGTPAIVVDHIIPHKGDKALFWDKSNWQPLCTTCHNSTKQKEERIVATNLRYRRERSCKVCH